MFIDRTFFYFPHDEHQHVYSYQQCTDSLTLSYSHHKFEKMAFHKKIDDQFVQKNDLGL